MEPRVEVGIDARDPVALAEFWSAALGYRVGDLDRAGDYLDLVPPQAALPVVYLQRVSEPKQTKNRLHLDLYVLDPQSTIARLVEIGARVISPVRTGSEGGWWQVLVDPEGNEFCVCQSEEPDESAP